MTIIKVVETLYDNHLVEDGLESKLALIKQHYSLKNTWIMDMHSWRLNKDIISMIEKNKENKNSEFDWDMFNIIKINTKTDKWFFDYSQEEDSVRVKFLIAQDKETGRFLDVVLNSN